MYTWRASPLAAGSYCGFLLADLSRDPVHLHLIVSKNAEFHFRKGLALFWDPVHLRSTIQKSGEFYFRKGLALFRASCSSCRCGAFPAPRPAVRATPSA